MIDETKLIAFLSAPDANQIIDLLDRMVPEQRARVVGMLRSLKGGENLRDTRYSTPPGPKRKAAREAYAEQLVGRRKMEQDAFVFQQAREGTGLKDANWQSWEDKFRPEVEEEVADLPPEAEAILTVIHDSPAGAMTGTRIAMMTGLTLARVNEVLEVLETLGAIKEAGLKVSAWRLA